MMNLRRFVPAVMLALMLVLVLAVPTFAVEAGDFDWASDITTNVAGITAGVIASIGAVFTVAVLVRLTKKAARIALSSLGLIR